MTALPCGLYSIAVFGFSSLVIGSLHFMFSQYKNLLVSCKSHYTFKTTRLYFYWVKKKGWWLSGVGGTLIHYWCEHKLTGTSIGNRNFSTGNGFNLIELLVKVVTMSGNFPNKPGYCQDYRLRSINWWQGEVNTYTTQWPQWSWASTSLEPSPP